MAGALWPFRLRTVNAECSELPVKACQVPCKMSECHSCSMREKSKTKPDPFPPFTL